MINKINYYLTSYNARYLLRELFDSIIVKQPGNSPGHIRDIIAALGILNHGMNLDKHQPYGT